MKTHHCRRESALTEVGPYGRRAFTLIEVVVTIAVFSILLLSVIGISRQVQNIVTIAQRKSTAATIAQEQLELVRNMTFDQIGTEVTYPTGPLQSTRTITRNGGRFTVKFSINFVDDPADGLAPSDTVPADYKRVEVQVCWDSGSCAKPVRLTTFVVPKTLEYATNAGALFITVVDANGHPVSGATVQVTNASPAVNVVNQTDVNGQLQLLDLPAAVGTYHVSVSKNGYSPDSTLAASVSNPHPTNPDTTVSVSQVTNVTLYIDKYSSLLVKALDQATCDGIGSVTVRVTGQRVIGTNPSVPVYDKTFSTDAAGQFLISNLPWDNYAMTISSVGNDVAGVTPPDTIRVNPGSSITSSVVLQPHQAHTARIIVRDVGTHTPIANTVVTLSNGGAYLQSLVTDQGTITQNNWVGGAGQSLFTDQTKFASLTGGMDGSSANLLSLAATDTTTSYTENFATNTAKDAGNTTADWNTTNSLVQLPENSLLPGSYASSATAQSLKLNTVTGVITSVTLTATTQLNGQTVNFFATADGTTFEPITVGVNHVFTTSGADLRWRAELSTTNTSQTPVITQVNLSYHQTVRSQVDGTLVSSTFDNGNPTNYTTLSWEPTSQPVSAGSNAVRFQVASSGATVNNGTPVADVSSDPATSPQLFTKNIGDSTNTVYLAQSFVASANDTVDSIDLKLAQHGSPSDTLTAFIYSNLAGIPTNNLSGSGQEITATLPSDSSGTWQSTWTTQPFAPQTALVAGTTYWLVLQVSGANSSKYWTTVRSSADTTYTGGTAKVGKSLSSLDLSNVCASGCDIAFKIRRSGKSETATTPSNFVGPDGTASTYFTTSGSSLPAALSGYQYLRYKLYLHTDDPLVTPSISRVSIIKNNACTPPGQVFFTPLPDDGNYSVSAIIDGYQSVTSPLNVVGNVSQYIDLTPNP